jgi:hypothetical protein
MPDNETWSPANKRMPWNKGKLIRDPRSGQSMFGRQTVDDYLKAAGEARANIRSRVGAVRAGP